MQDSITHEALEALLTRYEELVGRHYRGTLELRGQAEKCEADLRLARDARQALRTGQLVPVMPSEDEVKAVARAIYDAQDSQSGDHVGTVIYNSEHLFVEVREGETEAEATKRTAMQVCCDAATAAITTYEDVSGVAKMREASKTFAQMMEGWGPEYFPARIVTDYESTASAYDIRWEDIEALRAALGEKP